MSPKRSPTQRARACGKIRFRSQDEALRALHYLQTRSTREKVPVRVYQCDGCKGWHQTSQRR